MFGPWPSIYLAVSLFSRRAQSHGGSSGLEPEMSPGPAMSEIEGVGDLPRWRRA